MGDTELPAYSKRIDWSAQTNRLTLALEKKRRGGATILDLTESNPTKAGFDYPENEVRRAFAEPEMLQYDPHPAGLKLAREAVAAYYAGRGSFVEPGRVVMTASTSEAYSYLFKLLADANDEVLVPQPSYPLFEFLARLEGVAPVGYRLRYDQGWSVDMESVRAAMTERTRAVVVVNPNNPTGSFLKRREWEEMSGLCRKRNVAIICDEVFADYALEEDSERVTTLVDEKEAATFCLSGLSKVAGMPQLKAGWIVLVGTESDQAESRARLELIADTYLSVNTPVQLALGSLLKAGREVREQILERVRRNLAHLREQLSGAVEVNGPATLLSATLLPATLLEVEGGWYATLRVPRTKTEEQWCLELLEQDGVRVQPGFFYDFPDEAFLVVSLLTPLETFREGIGRLLSRLSA